jgi:hypothetical protein
MSTDKQAGVSPHATTIITRAAKGSALTWNEHDANHVNAANSADAAQATANNKQDTLVSGTNIKTINGASILGPGNLTVSGTGGSADALDIAFTAAVPLDTAGFGKRMRDSGAYSHKLTADVALSEGLGSVLDGSCSCIFLQDSVGAHAATTPPAWLNKGSDSLGAGPGAQTLFVASKEGTDVIFAWSLLSVLDVTAPTYVSEVIAAATPLVITVTMSENIGAKQPIAADITTGAAGGRTITGIAVSGAIISITYSSAWTSADAPTIAIAAGKIGDAAGNLSAALPATAVTNLIAPPKLAYDTFTRADNATSLGVSDDGKTWVVLDGVWGVAGGGASLNTPGATNSVAYLELGAGKTDFTLDCSFLPTAVWSGIAFNVVDLNNFDYMFQVSDGTLALQLKSVSGGVATDVALSANNVITNNTWVGITIVKRGTNITVKTDNTAVLTNVAMPTNASATKIGLMGFAAAVSVWDNFTVTP